MQSGGSGAGMPWVVPAVIGAASVVSGLWNNARNVAEARRNREWQERMSNTAHQREVADMRAARLNPQFSSMRGAGTPSGDRAQLEDVGPRAIQGALAVQQARASIDLTRNQANLVRAQENDLTQRFNAGSFDKYKAEAELAQLSTEQQRQLMPLLLEKARAEVEATVSSARAANARAVLDELAKSGAMNLSDFEDRIGEAGPWVRALFNLVRLMKR